MFKLVFFLLLSLPAFAQQTTPERIVAGHEITSQHDPAVKIALPSSSKYVGADRWVLYDIADCEIHVFVQADAQKKIQRLYWVQFEGYLPSKPDLRHNYNSTQHTQIGGLDFLVDASAGPGMNPQKTDSDAAHVYKLLTSQGYSFPAGMLYARMVHLLDEQKRQELMIVYAENASLLGYNYADLLQNGSAYTKWPTVEQGLIQRATSAAHIQPLKPTHKSN